MGEVIDGVMPKFVWGPLTLSTVAGDTPLRTVDIQPDRPAFSFNTDRGFFGAMLTVTLGSQHPYVYGLVQRDWNSQSESNINGIITRYAYNSDYIGAGSTGSITDHLQYGVEGVFECGNTLSDSSAVEPALRTRSGSPDPKQHQCLRRGCENRLCPPGCPQQPNQH